MYTLEETYIEKCKSLNLKPDKKKFRECEKSIRKTVSEISSKTIRDRVLVLHKEIDDTFVYVVILEGSNVTPDILECSEFQSRLLYARRSTHGT